MSAPGDDAHVWLLDNASDDTICPNTRRLGTMRAETLTLDLDLAMRAPLPPSPPRCVPTGQAYCPPS